MAAGNGDGHGVEAIDDAGGIGDGTPARGRSQSSTGHEREAADGVRPGDDQIAAGDMDGQCGPRQGIILLHASGGDGHGVEAVDDDWNIGDDTPAGGRAQVGGGYQGVAGDSI